MVPGVSCCKFFPNQMHISAKSFVAIVSVSTKSNHHLVCHSIMSLEPVPVNVSCTCACGCEFS